MHLAMIMMALLAEPPAQVPGAASPTRIEANTKADDIRRLLEVSGAGRMGQQVMDAMLPAHKKAFPQVPEAFWEGFRAEARGDDLIALVVPVYDKHLTHAEIRGLIEFYQGPLGQRLIEVQPQIVQESMAAGQKWGEGLARKILKRLQEKGYASSGNAG
ncbi:MAG TPA: DUF2059 domain-containing protein, partial [Vicinamibacteria bacterium]|nr:DUF2059 domain-containing protein [Vicinamibacteria bacterium]